MKISNKELIDDLVKRTNENLELINSLKEKSITDLNKKQTAESWSALECIEHLNRYGDFYLPEIKKQFLTAQQVPETTLFKSGLIGNYFAKSVQPLDLTSTSKSNKMKTFKAMNPNGSELSLENVETCIAQQKEMLAYLEKSRTIHLRKTKTAISISKVLKLRLGDTFRVVIYHNQRHLQQAVTAVR